MLSTFLLVVRCEEAVQRVETSSDCGAFAGRGMVRSCATLQFGNCGLSRVSQTEPNNAMLNQIQLLRVVNLSGTKQSASLGYRMFDFSPFPSLKDLPKWRFPPLYVGLLGSQEPL